MNDDRYVIRNVDKISLTISEDMVHQSILWGYDIIGFLEDEDGITVVSGTPIDGLKRGTVCDITVFAKTFNVSDETKSGRCEWELRDMLCTRVFHRQKEEKLGVNVIYRFIE